MKFDVDICEVRKRTVSVEALNAEAAKDMVEAEWRGGLHRLEDIHIDEVSFNATKHRRERTHER